MEQKKSVQQLEVFGRVVYVFRESGSKEIFDEKVEKCECWLQLIVQTLQISQSVKGK